MYNLKQRKKLRLNDYDYSNNGFYFVTFCTKWRQNFFWKIIDWKMILNDYWNIAQKCWNWILNHYKNIELDEFIIMPNHIHWIIIIVGNEYFRSDKWNICNEYFHPDKWNIFNKYFRSDKWNTFNEHFHPNKWGIWKSWNLSNIIKWFKIWVTKDIRQKYNDWEFWWQKSFFDIIIRNKNQLLKTREYIINNPFKWELDINNPKKTWLKIKKP